MPGTRESETRSRQRISIQGQRSGRRWLERDNRDSRGELDMASSVVTAEVVWVGQGNSDPGQLGVSGRFTSKGLDHWQLAQPHPSPHCGL